MNTPKKFLLPLVMICVLVAVVTTTHAQGAKDLVGAWRLVSAVNAQGAAKTDVYGPNPKGMMTFDASGHFSTIYMAADLPRFTADSRTAGTP